MADAQTKERVSKRRNLDFRHRGADNPSALKGRGHEPRGTATVIIMTDRRKVQSSHQVAAPSGGQFSRGTFCWEEEQYPELEADAGIPDFGDGDDGDGIETEGASAHDLDILSDGGYKVPCGTAHEASDERAQTVLTSHIWENGETLLTFRNDLPYIPDQSYLSREELRTASLPEKALHLHAHA